MNKNLVSLLVVAFIVAVIATGLFYGLFVGNLQQNPTPVSGSTIVVAKRSVTRGSVLQADDLKLLEWPANKPVAGGFGNANDAIGLTVLEPIQENEPIVQARLTPKTSAAAGVGVPAGMRAVTIHVTDSGGIVTMLRAGHKVDVQAIGERKTLRTILQNIEVLNVPGQENGRNIVNLLVTPDAADLVGLADSIGQVRLVLRNPQDGALTNRPNISAAAIFAESSTAVQKVASQPSGVSPAPVSATAALRPVAKN
jgi:Flp pilus assembly protein CpaB